jgi:hypothetical protein
MARIPALSFMFAVVALPALAEGTTDPATVTCKDYVSASHQGMLDISAAVHEALKDDPKFGALSEKDVDDKVAQACTAHPDAKVVDALHS